MAGLRTSRVEALEIGEFQAAGKSALSGNPTEAAWNSLSCYYWNKYLVDSAQAYRDLESRKTTGKLLITVAAK